jgi:hypothetical protein
MLWCTRCDFHKKCPGTRYAKIVLLHLVGSVGNIVHSSPSVPQIVDILFFMLEWARCGIYTMHPGTHYTEVVLYIRWDLRVT